MKIQEFNTLKVGNSVYVPIYDGKMMSAEVTAVDRFFKKVKYVSGGKWVSYRRVHRKTDKPVSCCCGIMPRGVY